MPDFSAALALLKKPIEDLYSSATGAAKEKLATLKAASRVKDLHKRLWESQRVKTIWHTDRPLSLSSFYHPVYVVGQEHGSNSAGTRLNSLDDLPNNHNIIFGTVGQGKSILLRYLLGKEIKSGSRIPVLFELRNAEKSLKEHLSDRFSLLLGIKRDDAIFSAFAKAGKLSLMLDGFDEIDPTNLQKITTEIDDLSYEFGDCRIVVSSRPDSDCKHLTAFHTNSICPLAESDLKSFYKRVTRDDDLTSRLFAAIQSSPMQIRELVRTPLLATLLAISYKAAHKIPLDFAEFYDELFQILLVRHDGSKLGWRRQRKTKLNDREIQQTFEAFCFATRRRQVTALDTDSAYQLASESLDNCGLQSDSYNFIEDIRKVTCLILEEGNKIHFVHASVQEFFASRYIKTRTEPVADKFYAQLLAGKWKNWRQELLFLLQIDEHRATKYFSLPDLNATLHDLLDGNGVPDAKHVKKYLSAFTVHRTKTVRDEKPSWTYSYRNRRKSQTYWYSLLDARVVNVCFELDSGGRRWNQPFVDNQELDHLTLYEVVVAQGSQKVVRLEELVISIINYFINECARLSIVVKKKETTTSFIDLG
ncbi:MAG: hypothetical protein GAK33_02338 [Burkholderia lata]|uniref:NACHT domain-containing protein n=1 Tax=Burkholderia lata (strain ATCC 17760 / DSM 23089 / LMG 22485 / NCIMB 9086 / R18194 / 383) TaxID=482957 RepID=A0A833PT65_BURL3|nr:hypothetical protein [Burkholderia lata]KAF1038283.1 MAG: hypothetical protein GAK33_02338 [Burkholderia lata]